MARPRVKGAKGKSVTMTGLPELRGKLLKTLFDAARERVREALTVTTEAVYVKAKGRVAVRTGKGQRSIRRRVNKAGTRGRVTHPKRTFWLRFLEFGTKRQKAQPWLFPSLEEEREPHLGRLRDAMNEAGKDVAE